MEKLSIKLIGETPLMTHNVRLANPLDNYVQHIKKLTGKRNKTDADIMEIARAEWEGSLYLYRGRVEIPGRCLNATFLKGAMKRKNGPKWKEGCYMEHEHCRLKYKEPMIMFSESDNGEIPIPELDKYFNKMNNQTMVVVGKQKVLRTRPIFYDWSLECSILYDEALIDNRTLQQLCEDAGYRVGLCERRPATGGSFGRFTIEVL